MHFRSCNVGLATFVALAPSRVRGGWHPHTAHLQISGVPIPGQKAEENIKNGKILAVLLHSFFKIQLLPDGTRQSYVLIGEGLGRNPGLTAGAGTSVVYHSAWLGANCLL